MSASDVLAVVAATVVDDARRACSRRRSSLLDAHAPRPARHRRRACARKRSRCSTMRATRCATPRSRSTASTASSTSAERVSDAVDGAQRIAARRSRSPVVKAMAFGTGVSRAAQRLREGEPRRADAGRRRRSAGRREAGVLMFKRLFWLVVGFALGARIVVGGRRAGCAGRRSATRRPSVVDRWSDNVRAAVDEGRDAMRAREAELKVELRPRGRAVAWTRCPTARPPPTSCAAPSSTSSSSAAHTQVPSASVIPVDKTLLFTVAGMVPFKSLLHRRGDAAVQACGLGRRSASAPAASTTTSTTSAAPTGTSRSSRCSATSASATTSRPRRSSWRGSSTREVLAARHRAASGSPCTRTTTRPSASGATRSASRPTGSSASARTTSGAWATPARAGRRRRSSGTSAPSTAPTAVRSTEHDRYIEIWNLVFMQFDQHADGTRVAAAEAEHRHRRRPRAQPHGRAGARRRSGTSTCSGRCIARGASGRPARATATTSRTDVSLRIIAEHARAMTFMITDGVRPSNQERGYVLRRIIRRAVRHAYLLGARDLVLPDDGRRRRRRRWARRTPRSSPTTTSSRKVVQREEEAFRATLQRGVDLLDEHRSTRGDVSGDDAFFLHDTLGFPIDLTREIAAERGRAVDLDGFEQRMARAARAGARRGAARPARRAGDRAVCRELVDEHGPTEFTGRQEYASQGDGARARRATASGSTRPTRATTVDVVLDRTPFYAESGGQVGDTGTITTADGADARRASTRSTGFPARSSSTRRVVRARHDRRRRRGRSPRSTACAATASAAITPPPTSCTGRCARCSARTCSRRARWSRPTGCASTSATTRRSRPSSSREVERLANEQVISDAPVRHYETTKAEAERIGAIAFFGEKYGDIVRVLEAGPSTELCGGTHVHALGFIGPIKIVSEGSIGSNLRRIEAITGDGALEYIEDEEAAAAPRRRRCCARRPKEVPEQDRAALRAGARAAGRAAAAQGEGSRLRPRATSRRQAEQRRGRRAPRRPRTRTSCASSRRRPSRALGSGVVGARRQRPTARPAIAVAVSKDLVGAGRGGRRDRAGPRRSCSAAASARAPTLVVGGGQNADGVDDALAARPRAGGASGSQ